MQNNGPTYLKRAQKDMILHTVGGPGSFCWCVCLTEPDIELMGGLQGRGLGFHM